MSECQHKNIEDVTSFEDQEPVWLCLDCGETVAEPKEAEGEDSDEGFPLQKETGQAILQVLLDIKVCLLDIALSARAQTKGGVYRQPGYEA